MVRCHIALGGNLGDVAETFRSALTLLASADLRVVAVSRLYETPPMGAGAGGTFLNAAAEVETELEPKSLLERLLATEDSLGRVRTRHWGPRAIDLDLIFYGDAVIETPRLRLPHPGCWYRRFVLDPLAEIAPDVRHPETGESVAELRQRLLPRPLPVAIDGSDADVLEREFPIVVEAARDCAVLVLTSGSAIPSAVRRVVGLPSGGERLDTARAVLTAALGEPAPVGRLD